MMTAAFIPLPAEFLRVNSPSAEVRGHGPGQEVLQTGKVDVKIDNLDAVATMPFVCISVMITIPEFIAGTICANCA